LHHLVQSVQFKRIITRYSGLPDSKRAQSLQHFLTLLLENHEYWPVRLIEDPQNGEKTPGAGLGHLVNANRTYGSSTEDQETRKLISELTEHIKLLVRDFPDSKFAVNFLGHYPDAVNVLKK